MSKTILTFREPINLINNLTTNQAGLGALDASMGAVLSTQLLDRDIIPPYSGNGVNNPKYYITGGTSYIVVNGICFCGFSGDFNPVPSGSTEYLVKNLPIPLITISAEYDYWSISSVARLLLTINISGQIIGASSGGYFAGTLIYPVK